MVNINKVFSHATVTASREFKHLQISHTFHSGFTNEDLLNEQLDRGRSVSEEDWILFCWRELDLQ